MVFDNKRDIRPLKVGKMQENAVVQTGRVNLLFFEGVEMCFMIAGFQFLVEPISQLQD